MTNVALHCGDCLEVMKTLEANSVHSIVCDPPYMLNFMGKAFDRAKDNPAASVEVWAEALRVAKPGAHLLAFGGDRTHHRMMTAIEDAGWEIRTCLYWIFGSGFPKSHDISKAIDRRRNDDIRHVCRYLRSVMERQGKNSRDIAEVFGFHSRMVDHWAARDTDSQPSMPTWEQWLQLKKLLAFSDEMDAEVWRLNGRKGKPGEAWYDREVIGQDTKARSANGKSALPTMGAPVEYQTWDITAPATDAARQWAGWGTSLKPAVEIIVMARKPLSEPTVAQNVLVHGVGGINVDACRIGTSKDVPASGASKANNGYEGGWGGHEGRENGTGFNANIGRWPSNLLLDDEAARLLDEMSGERPSGSGNKSPRKHDDNSIYGKGLGYSPNPSIGGDSGGASRFFLRVAHDEDDVPLRFFYVPKASKRDRDEGLEGMEERLTGHKGNLVCLVCGRQKFSGSPCECAEPLYENKPLLPRANHHPTVKPTKLMQWLVRLVTPPNGTILDPFLGSGSTGKAAKLEGFHFVGIEIDAEYLAIAEKRIAAAQPEVKAQLPLLELAAAEEAHQ